MHNLFLLITKMVFKMWPLLYLFQSSIVIFFFFTCIAQGVENPTGFVFPVSKNSTTNQYNIYTSMGKDYYTFWHVALDLGGKFLWLGCDKSDLPSYRPIPFVSKKCKVAKGTKCTNNTCAISLYNPLTYVIASEELGEGVLTVASTNGLQRLSKYEIPHFEYSCVGSRSSLLKGLSEGALAGVGIAGLGRVEMSLPKQVSKAFKLPQKFAICLRPSEELQGDLFISEGPYYLPPYVGDVRKILLKTPLIDNPVSDLSNEYFISVKSIKIDGKIVYISPSLLAIDKKGFGGTKFSTMVPYTVLHSFIFKAITSEFIKNTGYMKIKRLVSVKPFGACFSSKEIVNSKTGPRVPKIDLVFQSEEVYWRINGHNSMVNVSKNVMCLALIDGGSKVKTSIVLGEHQLEDNLIQFDSDSSSFRFSNSLLLHNTNCSHFRTF